MNEELKEIWKRKLIELENKAREINKEWSRLINILNEINKKTNLKLNSLLADIDLGEEISYLNDWKEFYLKQVEKYTDKLKKLEQEAAEEKIEKLKESLAKETSVKLELEEKEKIKEQEKVIVEKEPIEKIVNRESKLDKYKILKYAIPAVLLLMIISSLLFLKPAITGYVVVSKEFTYSQNLNLIVNESSEHVWSLENKGDLKDIKVNGKIIENSNAKIYVEKEDRLYLIFDSEELTKDTNKITGFVVNENITNSEILIDYNNVNEINNINQGIPSNQTVEDINKTIIINLEYETDSNYDIENDGIEPITGVIDLTVRNTQFNWPVDYDKVCTRWEIYSIDNNKNKFVCYGNEKCCNFIDLEPIRSFWNETFYSYYGLEDTTNNNIISVQVIYVDYNLSLDEPYAKIYYSDWQNLSARYYEEIIELIEFKDICSETCVLKDFNKDNYTLIFEISNGTLYLDNISYTITKEIKKIKPNLRIENSGGKVFGNYNIYKDNVLIAEEALEPDYYDIEVIPTEKIIEKLLIYNANITEPLTADIGIDDVSREQQIKDVEIKKQYAIDTSEIKFETASLTATAQANALYKCKQWDYSTEVCYGTWEKIKDLTVGQEYEITITQDDSGFVEGNINITIVPINITGLTLIKDIQNITIIKNTNATIDLNGYFSNTDNNTIFNYNQINNINIIFKNNVATIVPAKDFIGIGFTFITAAKDDESVFSNVFSITVTNATIDVTPEIILEKKDFKFDEDIELDFEYLGKEELIEHGRWKEEYEVYEEKTEKTEEELELLKQKIAKKEKQNKKWETTTESIETFVYDNEGNLKDIEIEIEELREGRFDIKLKKQRAFKAGKYTIKLELIKDGVTYTQEQDFTWGVLAINVNKSIYLENEDSFIGIGVLDDEGKIVCDAGVTLEIISPLNEKTILTTANNEIKISPECETLGVTLLPDYYTTYSVNGAGNYIMNLTAVTSNGVRSIQDNFTVASSVDFDVARKGPTRVYPAVPYTMNISIIANENYNGAINEYVPAGFDISNVELIEVSESEITLSSAKDTGIGNKVPESLSEITLSAINEKAINTGNHPYLVKRTNLEDLIGNDLNLPSSLNSIKKPLKSSGLDLSLSNLENEFISDSILRCGILNQTTENIFSLLNSIKSSSLVTSTLCSNLENSASLPFESLFGFEITSTPFYLRDLFNLSSTFSSKRNLSLDGDVNNDIFFTPSQVCCILQSCSNMLLGQRRECLKDFFERISIFQQLKHLPDHDSCPLEGGLSMADFAIRNNILVNFDSHRTNNGNSVFKAYGNQEIDNNQNTIDNKQNNNNENLKTKISDFFTLIPLVEAQVNDIINSKKNSYNQNHKPSSLINSEVEYILTRDCFFSSLSSDQMEQLSFNANAKKSESSESGEISLASPKNSSKSSVLKNPISGASKIRNEKISSSFNPDFFIISDLCSRNSFKINLGETRSSLLSKNRFNVLPFAIIAENSSLASTTSNIYSKPFFFNSLNLPSLSFLPSSTASSSVSLLLPAMVLSATNLTNSSATDLVTALDTSKLSSFISLSNSSGISTFSSAILSSDKRYENEYLKLSNKQLKNNSQNTTTNEINLNKITENIADFFTLMPSVSAQPNNQPNGITITTINGTKIISIPANLKKGKKYIVSYEFDAPDISPEFYLLGPLDIGAFAEKRNWQIANDQFAGFGYNITYPDAGAPGMNLVVQFVTNGNNFTATDYVQVNSSGNITVGPIILTGGNGSWVTTNGPVLSTVFYIHPNATAQNVNVSISGKSWSVFQIIVPALRSGNFSNAAAGKYMIGNNRNGTRTSMGTIVLDSLIIPSNVIVVVNTTDLDPTLVGDQGKLPVHIIVDGPVNISGILNVSGFSGSDGVATDNGGDGGDGGPGGGGGGGGGGGIPLLPSVAPAADFSIDKKSIKVKLNPGESKRENIKIENTGTISLEIEIDLRNLEDFIHFPTGIGSYSFTLDPKESKTIQLTFNAPEGREPGVISGKILIKGGSIEKSITTVIEIQSEKPLFDVDMEIPTQFQQVFSGSEVLAQINIFNIMGISKVDVTVDYGIKDKEGTEIISSQETIGVEIKTSFVRSLKLPENIKPGKYVFYAKVSYAGLTATASSLFDVVEKKFKLDEIFTPINLIIVISFAVLTIFLIFIMLALLNLTHLHRKEIKQGMEKPQIQIPDKKVPTAEELLAEIEKTKEFEETERKDAIKPIKEKVIERLQIKPEMSKERLNEQLKLLEESFKSGLISKYAYEKDKKKIGNMLKDL